MPDTLERPQSAADERPAAIGASADSDTGAAEGASVVAHVLGLVVAFSDASAASASEDEQLRGRFVSWMETLDVPEMISQVRFVPLAEVNVAASPDSAAVGAVVAGSAATAEAPRAGATDTAVASAEFTSDATREEDGSLVFVMDGRPTRVSASDATHWARYRDAPDDEWGTWQVDHVTRKRVRR